MTQEVCQTVSKVIDALMKCGKERFLPSSASVWLTAVAYAAALIKYSAYANENGFPLSSPGQCCIMRLIVELV